MAGQVVPLAGFELGDYRLAVQSIALTTTDSRTNRSIDCIIAKLPPDRPGKPAGGY